MTHGPSRLLLCSQTPKKNKDRCVLIRLIFELLQTYFVLRTGYAFLGDERQQRPGQADRVCLRLAEKALKKEGATQATELHGEKSYF